MTVIVEKSVCFDCKGKLTCQRLKRLIPGKTIKEEVEHTHSHLSKDNIKYRERRSEIFEMVIINCSMKNQYDTREKFSKEVNKNG